MNMQRNWIDVEECEQCNLKSKGQLLNLIISNDSNECELVKLCTNDTGHFVNRGVVDDVFMPLLDSIAEKYESQDYSCFPGSDEEYRDHEKKLNVSMEIERDKVLDEYSSRRDFPVHGIGLVTFNTSDYYSVGEKYIKIIWKEKSKTEIIEDSYNESFGVF